MGAWIETGKCLKGIVMSNFNKVFLMGNLTRDPELRYTPSGMAIVKFGMAINRTFKSQEGEQKKETCFVDITMFGRRAEVVSEYFSKGSPIFIEGRLQYDQWEGQDGQKRNKLVVVAENFEFVGGAKKKADDGFVDEAQGMTDNDKSKLSDKDGSDPEVPF